MSWCGVCGRYHLFGACPRPELQDPPYPGIDKKTIATDHPPRPVAGPEISIDGQRGRCQSCPA
jgi:hypothetical protein